MIGLKRALATVRRRQEGAFAEGLLDAGRFLLSESQAIVPVEFGNLRGSGGVRKEGKGFGTQVIVYYTADYAVYVHEIDPVDSNGIFRRHGADYNAWHGEEIAAGKLHSRGPLQQAKFLEQPAREKRKEIFQYVIDALLRVKGGAV